MSKMLRTNSLVLVVFAALAALAVVAKSPTAAAASKEEDAIKARVAEFIGIFNKGDAKALSMFWTDAGSLVNPVGAVGKGRAGVEKVIATDIATILHGAKMEMQVTTVHLFGKDAAWIEIEHTVTGAMSPEGKAMPPMTFHVPCLMMKKGKDWMIVEARPYAYLPPTPMAKK